MEFIRRFRFAFDSPRQLDWWRICDRKLLPVLSVTPPPSLVHVQLVKGTLPWWMGPWTGLGMGCTEWRIFSSVVGRRSFPSSKTDDGGSDEARRERKVEMASVEDAMRVLTPTVHVRAGALDRTLGSAVVRCPVGQLETPTDTY